MGLFLKKKITVLGFAFKPNTNDTRDSPSIHICNDLLEEGCFLSIYDPKVNENQIKKELLETENSKSLDIANSLYEAAKGSDAIIILTDWEEFFNIDFKKLSKIMRAPSWIFDSRNVVDQEIAKNFGFKVWKLGNG